MYLIDTNIFAYHLQQQFEPHISQRLAAIFGAPYFVNDVITIELLCWKGYNTESDQFARELIAHGRHLVQDQQIVRKAIELRRKHPLKLGDAIIAATALVYDLMLVTRNFKDFARIEVLRLNNPFE